MIKINLALRKSPASTGAAGAKPGATRVGVDLGELKELPFRKIALMAGVGFLASWAVDSYKVDELQKADGKLSEVTAKLTRTQEELAKTKGYEAIKKSLDADEVTLKTKMDTIQKLLDDRTTPPKLLLAISTAIPAEIWLTEFQIRDASLVLKGNSLGFNQVSDFMKSLDESVYFKETSLKSTQQLKESTGTTIATFELGAVRR